MNKSRNKIALLVPAMKIRGGTEIVAQLLIDFLISSRYEVKLFTSCFNNKIWNKPKDLQIFEYGKKGHRFVGKKISSQLTDFDLIITTNHPTNLILYFAKNYNHSITSKTLCYCQEPLRRLYPDYTNKNYIKSKSLFNRFLFILIARLNRFFNWHLVSIDKKAYMCPDYIFANSRFTADNIKSIYNRDTSVCYPASNISYIDQVEYDKYFFSVSRIEKQKNLISIIKAVKILNDTNSLQGYKYFIAGTGKKINSVSRFIQKLQLDNCIILLSGITDEKKSALFRNTSFSAYLPFDEPFGLVCVESLFYQKPVITSSTGGVIEIVRNGFDGFCVNEKDPKSIANAIKAFIDNIELVKSMGKTGYKKVKEEFSIENFKKRFLTIIENILHKY